MPRRLNPEESALWARVTATVRPLDRRRIDGVVPQPPAQPASAPVANRPQSTIRPAKPVPPRATSANTLDGGWDRRLSSGRITPDVTIDLHGYTLASAHALLERSLGEAIAHGDRVMLVITGNPPNARTHGDRPRGLIRQQMPLWIASSSYRDAIAAVRGAHPRHGGRGALYLILRRQREVGQDQR